MRRGFTLVEAVVVVLVIAVGLLVLLPVISPHKASRESARRKSCASNLRQFGLAAATYSGDYRDQLPTVISNADGIAKAGDGLASMALMYDKYIDDVLLFKCPSDKNAKLIDPKTFKAGDVPTAAQSSYGWDPLKQQDDGSSDVAYAADGGEVNGVNPADGTNSDCHGPDEGQNVLYLDFHVSWEMKPTAGFAGDNIYLPGNEASPEKPQKLSYILK